MCEKIKNKLNTGFIGKRIISVEQTDSTNSLAKRENEKENGTVFIASRQTNGRGRNGRKWISSNDDGLWMSILLKPMILPQKLSALTLLAGLCVVKVLREKYGADAFVKWPNDIVLSQKKLGGILCESAFEGDSVSYAIVGIGINLFCESFDKEIENIACSLYAECGNRVERETICADILNLFEQMYTEFLKSGINAFLPEYKKYCITLEKEIKVIKNGEEQKAVAKDITPNGELIIETEKGVFPVISGEVCVRGLFGYV